MSSFPHTSSVQPPLDGLPISVALEIEYLATVTFRNSSILLSAEAKVRLYPRLLEAVARALEIGLKATLANDAPPVVCVCVDGPIHQFIALQQRLGRYLDFDDRTFWVCKKEVGLDSGQPGSYGVEITSPPYPILNAQGVFCEHSLHILGTVLHLLGQLSHTNDNLGSFASDDGTLTSLLNFQPMPETSEVAPFVFHLSAPPTAGIHVHAGPGLDDGARFSDDAIRNITLLSWYHESQCSK